MRQQTLLRLGSGILLGGALFMNSFAVGSVDAEDGAETVKVTVKQKDIVDNRKEIKKTAAKGNKLEVKLEVQATGYTWKLAKDEPLKLKREGEPKIERTENQPGAPEYKVFRFEVLDRGELEFQLARPFGKSEPKILRLKVDLKE
jgi:predicted secreted protein